MTAVGHPPNNGLDLPVRPVTALRGGIKGTFYFFLVIWLLAG